MIPRDTHLQIGSLLFEGLDQIDLTGPFEVLSRIPNSTYRIYGKTAASVRDLKGLRLTPDAVMADAPPLDVLHVPGGPGQEAVMDDEKVLAWIRQQAAGACSIFSVCTGALICGAAGLLKGRRATTHWASFHMLSYFGAIPVNERVVVDGAWGFRCGRHGGHRRCITARSRVARRRGRPGDSTRHGLRAGTAVQQWHARDGGTRDPQTSATIRASAHGAAGKDGTTYRRQTRHCGSGYGRSMTSRDEKVWREPRGYWRIRQRASS
jgi:putative intracellular protease/amidase